MLSKRTIHQGQSKIHAIPSKKTTPGFLSNSEKNILVKYLNSKSRFKFTTFETGIFSPGYGHAGAAYHRIFVSLTATCRSKPCITASGIASDGYSFKSSEWVHSDVSIQQDDIHVNHAQQSTESDRCSKTE